MKIYTIQWNHVSSPANCEPEEYELNDVPSIYTSLEKAKEDAETIYRCVNGPGAMSTVIVVDDDGEECYACNDSRECTLEDMQKFNKLVEYEYWKISVKHTDRKNKSSGIGRRIKLARMEKHLTMEQLANIMNVSRTLVNHYELGLRNIKDSTLKKYANALDVNFYKLKYGVVFDLDNIEKILQWAFDKDQTGIILDKNDKRTFTQEEFEKAFTDIKHLKNIIESKKGE